MYNPIVVALMYFRNKVKPNALVTPKFHSSRFSNSVTTNIQYKSFLI